MPFHMRLFAALQVYRLIEQRPLHAGAQHSSFERLIAGTIKALAGFLISDNFPLVCAECSKGFKLAIEILLACGNASVVKSFMNRFTTKKSGKVFRFPDIFDCCGWTFSDGLGDIFCSVRKGIPY